MMLSGLAAIVGLALVLHRYSRLPVAVCPALAVALVILIVYAGALAGHLRLTTQALFAIGLAFFAFEAAMAARERFGSAFFQPSMAIPLILCMALSWRLRDATFIVWDDFTTWALASKEMFARHGLVGADTNVIVGWYPPAVNLFHYFVLAAAPQTEGNVMAAHAALLILPLACLFHGLTWRQWPLALAFVAAIYFALTILGLGFQTAMADHVLGVFCTAAVICYLILRHADRSVVWIAPLLFTLTLIKVTGGFFAGMAGLTMALDCALHQRERGKEILRPTAIVLLVALAAPLVAAASWRAHLSATGVNPPSTDVTLARLVHEWSPSGSETSKAIRENFLEALWRRSKPTIDPDKLSASRPAPTSEIPQPYAPVVWCVVLIILVSVPALLGTQLMTRRRVAALVAMGAVTLVTYAAILLALYTLAFSSYEGLRLASMDRYLNSGLAAALLIALFLLSIASAPRRLPRGTLAVLAVAGLFVVEMPSPATLRTPEIDPFREEIAWLLSQVAAIVPPDKTVFSVHQDSQGGEVVRIRFALAPRKPSGYWSLGRPYEPDDVWTTDLTPAEFVGVLRGADYLFLSNADTQFWDTYGELFSPEDRYSNAYLYRIETQAADVKLVAAVGADGRKLADPRFKRLTITNRPRLLDDIEITPLRDAWPQVFLPARVENEGFRIDGGPATASYYALSETYHLPKGTLVAADVTVRQGGLVIGLLDSQGQWARRVPMPTGHFLAVVEVEQPGGYRIAVAPPGSSQHAVVDIEVTRIGFLGGVRARQFDPVPPAFAPRLEELAIAPLVHQDWATILPPAVVSADGVVLHGPATAFYAVRSHMYRLPSGTLVAAKGMVNDGGLVLGLLNSRNEWVDGGLVSIPPGPFFAVVQTPRDGDYHVVLGHAQARAFFDAEVTAIGFLGARPVRAETSRSNWQLLRSWLGRLWPRS
jgi:hypothetical protein